MRTTGPLLLDTGWTEPVSGDAVNFKAYENSKEPTVLGLLMMISLYESLKRRGFEGPGKGCHREFLVVAQGWVLRLFIELSRVVQGFGPLFHALRGLPRAVSTSFREFHQGSRSR